MILRRVIQHVQDQNWTAIAIDVVIVVLGVFIGIQLGNWNAAQSDRARERLLLAELHTEVAESIAQLAVKREAYAQVGRSGERAVAFLDAGDGCGDACWDILVDFYHASQWQQVTVPRSTYDEMRRNGWPRNRAIVEAMEDYHRQADQFAQPLEVAPAYRSLVRGLIPLGGAPAVLGAVFRADRGRGALPRRLPRRRPADRLCDRRRGHHGAPRCARRADAVDGVRGRGRGQPQRADQPRRAGPRHH